ncbi:hypothetical protein [Planctomycetes bacterium K23_9]|uniref:Uncharacterized protein n=1 Tax=Stieleria marina TaxID=1930275 RepID=A0A517NMG5_9BACT|nr:hypothetical protein K239x_02630 [Planctomycetes bacterium K23_9]
MIDLGRLTLFTSLLACAASIAVGQDNGEAEPFVCGTAFAIAQAGGGSMPIIDNKPLRTIVEPQTEVAQTANAALDQDTDLGEIKTSVGELATTLSEQLKLPVFVDTHAIDIAGLDNETIIESPAGAWPLRSAFRRMLRPHGLRVSVEDEGFVVTADFAQLVRRGIATDYWISADPEGNEQISKTLGKKLTVGFKDLQLDTCLAELSEQTGIDMIIDRRALEEIGLTADTPVTCRLKSVSLRSALRLMLRELDLTYHIQDEVLEITTIEACEQNLVNRVYFLEATGFPIGDFDNVIAILETTIAPDTWESLGGPSTIAPLTQGQRSRPAILVSTTSDVHNQIADLLKAMRKTHVGADPIAARSPNQPPEKKVPQSGGMF